MSCAIVPEERGAKRTSVHFHDAIRNSGCKKTRHCHKCGSACELSSAVTPERTLTYVSIHDKGVDKAIRQIAAFSLLKRDIFASDKEDALSTGA